MKKEIEILFIIYLWIAYYICYYELIILNVRN